VGLPAARRLAAGGRERLFSCIRRSNEVAPARVGGRWTTIKNSRGAHRNWWISPFRPRPPGPRFCLARRGQRDHTKPAVLAETVNDLRESPRTRNGLWNGSQNVNRGSQDVEGSVAGSAVAGARSAVRASGRKIPCPRWSKRPVTRTRRTIERFLWAFSCARRAPGCERRAG
jgi:hypothetical protein